MVNSENCIEEIKERTAAGNRAYRVHKIGYTVFIKIGHTGFIKQGIPCLLKIGHAVSI